MRIESLRVRFCSFYPVILLLTYLAGYPLTMEHSIERVKLNTPDGVQLSCLYIPSARTTTSAGEPAVRLTILLNSRYLADAFLSRHQRR